MTLVNHAVQGMPISEGTRSTMAITYDMIYQIAIKRAARKVREEFVDGVDAETLEDAILSIQNGEE